MNSMYKCHTNLCITELSRNLATFLSLDPVLIIVEQKIPHINQRQDKL